jgi:hypothetical protein
MTTKTVAQTPILGAGAPARSVYAADTASREEDVRRPYGAIVILGITLAFVGWLDVALNLFPPAFGNPDWEIGTISITIDSLPLGTLGMGLATVGAALRGRSSLLRVLAVFAWCATIFVAAAAALYLLSLPVVWAALAAPMRAPFSMAAGKTALLGTVYLLFYAWLGVFAWSHARSIRRTS